MDELSNQMRKASHPRDPQWGAAREGACDQTHDMGDLRPRASGCSVHPSFHGGDRASF